MSNQQKRFQLHKIGRTIDEIEQDVITLTNTIISNREMEIQLEFHGRFERTIENGFATSIERNQYSILKERHYAYEHHLHAAKYKLAIYKHEVLKSGRTPSDVQYSATMSNIESLQAKIQEYLLQIESTRCPCHEYRAAGDMYDVDTTGEMLQTKGFIENQQRYQEEHLYSLCRAEG